MGLSEKMLLEEMLQSETFVAVLKNLADYKRQDLMSMLVSAHNVQNAQAAAMYAGQVDVLDRLPELFRELLGSQTRQ
jgi:hypothetical protein